MQKRRLPHRKRNHNRLLNWISWQSFGRNRRDVSTLWIPGCQLHEDEGEFLYVHVPHFANLWSDVTCTWSCKIRTCLGPFGQLCCWDWEYSQFGCKFGGNGKAVQPPCRLLRIQRFFFKVLGNLPCKFSRGHHCWNKSSWNLLVPKVFKLKWEAVTAWLSQKIVQPPEIRHLFLLTNKFKLETLRWTFCWKRLDRTWALFHTTKHSLNETMRPKYWRFLWHCRKVLLSNFPQSSLVVSRIIGI